MLAECCFTSTETVGLLGTEAWNKPRQYLDFTQLLICLLVSNKSSCTGVKQIILYWCQTNHPVLVSNTSSFTSVKQIILYWCQTHHPLPVSNNPLLVSNTSSFTSVKQIILYWCQTHHPLPVSNKSSFTGVKNIIHYRCQIILYWCQTHHPLPVSDKSNVFQPDNPNCCEQQATSNSTLSDLVTIPINNDCLEHQKKAPGF